MNDFINEKKVAVVTGASRGIGKAISCRLAQEGYNLVITCSGSYDELSILAGELSEKYGITCVPRLVDAGDYERVLSLFEEKLILDNGVDILVNNAGVAYVGLLHEMTPEQWRRVTSVNLDGVFYACKNAIPHMLKKHSGAIVNISSVWGNVGASMEVAYSATKGAVNSFTKALAKELAPSRITVNAVACGLIDTKMNACFSEEELAGVVEEIPADRIGRPEEIADIVLRVATAPDYMTGQIITVDGGWT